MKKTFTLLTLLISSIVHAQIPTDGLFAYYPMNNNGNDSAGTMHGTIMNVTPTTDRFGLNNKAYYFNGSSAYIALGSDPFAWRINNADGVTVSAWVKTDATFGEGLAAVFARWNNSSTHDDYGCFLMQGTGNQLFAVNGVNNNGVQGSVGVNDNEWHHVLYSYSRLTGVTTMYVDGVQAYQQTLGTNPTSPSTNSSVRIGAQSSSSGQNAPHIRYFKGSMDDVRMYKRPFTAQEVTDLYSAELASPDCQAVAVNQHPQGAGICAGISSATLSVVVAEPTATIQWQFNDGNGWGDMTGEMGLTVEAAAAGQYRAKVTADCGTISYSDAATVASGGPSFVEPMPTQAWLCSDQPHVLLTANAVGDGITYQWRRNEPGQPSSNQIDIPGATASTHEATEGVFYTVVITACGVSESSDLIQVSNFPAPTVTIIGNEPTTICQGASISLFSQISQNGTQVWEPGSVAFGNITVTPTETTVYTVTHTTTLTGCTATASRTIIVAEPEIPVIIDNMGVLEFATAGFHSYNWQLDGVDIPFAGFETYTPTQSGSYTLRAVHQTPGVVNGCPVVSEPYNVLITGIAAADGRNFSVSPNPFHAELTVTVKEPTVISLFNVLGEMVLTQTVNGRAVIATDALPAGLYFLRDSDSTGLVRVVKQ